MKIGIIGAGPAGMTAAYELTKAGIEVDVYEQQDTVGGMAKTIDLWGQKVDLGPHRFFSGDPRINSVWLEVARKDYEMVNRLTRIFYKGKFFYYPLKPFNALKNLGIFEALRCVFSYAKEILAPTPLSAVPTFEEWVIKRFGRRLFSIFFKTYSEKLWGIPCAQLDADFAAQRIKKFSLPEAIKSALGLSRNKHKTLVDQFAYPLEGTGTIYQRMADACQKNGGTIHLNTQVHRVIIQDGRATAIECTDGTQRAYDHIISTMPITQLVSRIPDRPQQVQAALDKLRYRNTILVFLQIDGADLFNDNWLYIHSSELDTGRITNFRNWTASLYGTHPETIVALEYWCYSDDALWQAEDVTLIEKARAEFTASGLLGKHRVLKGHVVRLEYSYPVYACGYKAWLAPVVTYVKTIKNLALIGRYGSFKYNNQDHSILMGLLAADNIIRGPSHDLWSINTDDEYQESSTIDKAGLKGNA